MGFFKDLKFGGGSIGTFDNSKSSAGAILDLVKNGNFRTEGTFAPGYSNVLLNDPTNYLTGLVKPEGAANTNKPTDWSPVFNINALSVVKLKGGTVRYAPGFLPPSYLSKQIIDIKLGQGKANEYSWNPDNAWIGHLLNSHIESDWYNDFTKNFISTDTKQKLEESTKDKVEGEAYSARDYYLRFNDQGTDYFRHGLHIDGYTNLKSGKGVRESWDGSGDSFRLASFQNTPYENNDPVVYGFELIIDSFSSPLLNGSVEDFIAQFSYVSEVASRAIVMDDFKRQFAKIFRTKGTLKGKDYSDEDVLINKQRNGQVMYSNTTGLLSSYAETDTKTNLYRPGKKAYMSYYLQKIDGLSKLIEANTSEAKKFLTEYNKDVIKLTFLEDVSGTMGALAHLYKLLYWSRPNGKNIVPENLLRFNCEIVVSECRNFNRVRKATENGNLEVIKDNVTRYIYSLKECQFYFNTMPHEDSIDMGNIKTYGDGNAAFEVSFDYKYASMKLEKWTPDPKRFGQYVGYNNGAIWKIGNKGMREATGQGKFVTIDTSVPKFYTIGTNTLRGNGVAKALVMDSYNISPESDGDEAKIVVGTSGDETPSTVPAAPAKNSDIGEDEENKGNKPEEKKKKRKEMFEQFKDNAKKAAVNFAKGTAKYVFNEINNQINIRAKLLEATINKARALMGMGGLKNEPKKIYPRPYQPNSFGIFFDVRNELFNFVGEEIAGIIGGAMQSVLPGTQLNVPFTPPNVGATLDKLTKGFSLYDGEAKLIAALKSKGPKMPFFDDSKHSTKFAGQSINKIYNTNTELKYPNVPTIMKFGGGMGVAALSFMKPIKKLDVIYSGKTIWTVMPINGGDNMLGVQFPKSAQKFPAPVSFGGGTLDQIWNSQTTLSSKYGTKDTTQIGFGVSTGGDHQKYPAPLIKSNKTLTQIVVDNTKAGSKYGSTDMSQVQFPNPPQKYPAPTIQSSSSLEQIVKAGTIWSFPVNDKKFGL